MDLYAGLYDFKNFSTQVHDFDPGIKNYPDGLFWTVPIASVGPVDLGTGTAEWSASNLKLTDYFNIPNALFRSDGSTTAMVNFDIVWSGPVMNRGPVTGPAGSTGELIMNSATIKWSASNGLGFTFASDPSGTKSVFAQLGHVSNGVFAE